MFKYFRIVGVKGAVKLYEPFDETPSSMREFDTHLSTRSGSNTLYASYIFFPSFRMSGFASVAAHLIRCSISLLRASRCRSGGLKLFKHAYPASATVSLRDTDLSRAFCTR